jgi:hypothetical protein
MRHPLLVHDDQIGEHQIHFNVQQPQGNLIHRGGAHLCWCLPSRSVEVREDGKLVAVYTHRDISFN